MTNEENAATTQATVDAFNGDDAQGQAYNPGQIEFNVKDDTATPEEWAAAQAQVQEAVVRSLNAALAANLPFMFVVLEKAENVTIDGQAGLDLHTTQIGLGSVQDQINIVRGVSTEINKRIMEEWLEKAQEGEVNVGGEPEHVANDDGMQAAIGAAHPEPHE